MLLSASNCMQQMQLSYIGGEISLQEIPCWCVPAIPRTTKANNTADTACTTVLNFKYRRKLK